MYLYKEPGFSVYYIHVHISWGFFTSKFEKHPLKVVFWLNLEDVIRQDTSKNTENIFHCSDKYFYSKNTENENEAFYFINIFHLLAYNKYENFILYAFFFFFQIILIFRLSRLWVW
jgi:hypothetical protein